MTEITAVFISPDRRNLAFEVDDGDGGVFVLDVEIDAPPEEIDFVDPSWIALGGGR